MNIGRAGYVGDSLFVCTCEDKKCAWTDKYAKSVIKKDDPIYPSYVIANAIRDFGLCGQKLYGEIKKVNDDYVLCSKKDNKWEVVDSLDYYLGMCSEENTKACITLVRTMKNMEWLAEIGAKYRNPLIWTRIAIP